MLAPLIFIMRLDSSHDSNSSTTLGQVTEVYYNVTANVKPSNVTNRGIVVMKLTLFELGNRQNLTGQFEPVTNLCNMLALILYRLCSLFEHQRRGNLSANPEFLGLRRIDGSTLPHSTLPRKLILCNHALCIHHENPTDGAIRIRAIIDPPHGSLHENNILTVSHGHAEVRLHEFRRITVTTAAQGLGQKLSLLNGLELAVIKPGKPLQGLECLIIAVGEFEHLVSFVSLSTQQVGF